LCYAYAQKWQFSISSELYATSLSTPAPEKNQARVIIYKTRFTTVVRTNNLQALTLMTNNWSTLKMSHDTVSDSAAQEHTVTIEMKGTREGFCVKTERINPGKDLLNLDLSKKKKSFSQMFKNS
jgi:hypothetical protein